MRAQTLTSANMDHSYSMQAVPGREHSLGLGQHRSREVAGAENQPGDCQPTTLSPRQVCEGGYHCVHNRTPSSPRDFSAGRAGRILQWFKGQNVAVRVGNWKESMNVHLKMNVRI